MNREVLKKKDQKVRLKSHALLIQFSFNLKKMAFERFSLSQRLKL